MPLKGLHKISRVIFLLYSETKRKIERERVIERERYEAGDISLCDVAGGIPGIRPILPVYATSEKFKVILETAVR